MKMNLRNAEDQLLKREKLLEMYLKNQIIIMMKIQMMKEQMLFELKQKEKFI